MPDLTQCQTGSDTIEVIEQATSDRCRSVPFSCRDPIYATCAAPFEAVSGRPRVSLALDLVQAEKVRDDIIPLFAGEREHWHTRVGRRESDEQRGTRHPRGGC